MSSEGTTWYFAGQASLSDGSINLPPTIIYPDESDIDLPEDDVKTESTGVEKPFRESDDIYYQYQTHHGFIVISHPDLEETRDHPRAENEYNLEPNFYTSAGRGGYSVSVSESSDGNYVNGWVLTVPVDFYPEKVSSTGRTPVDQKAALPKDGKAITIFREGMNEGYSRSCYLIRRDGYIEKFFNKVIDGSDEVVIFESGFQDGGAEEIIEENKPSFEESIDRSPRFI